MNLYTGLLFHGGHIADPKLAIELSQSSTDRSARGSPVAVGGNAPRRRGLSGRVRWLVEELVLLGGRPVSREHLDDIDEPFPPLHRC